MGFKDFVNKDLDVFMNAEDLAELHDIDGNQLPAILDRNVLKPRGSVDGVYEGEKLLFVKLSALGYRPVSGQYLNIDGEIHTVSECIENAGMLEITLEANQA